MIDRTNVLREPNCATRTTAKTGALRDCDIRPALIRSLQISNGAADGVIVTELPVAMGVSKLDVAVLNGRLVGYEIKSDRDSLSRIEHQLMQYQEVCDELTIVTTERHHEMVEKAVPEWSGIIIASVRGDAVSLDTYRAAMRNPNWDVLALMLMLWQSETVELARSHGFRAPREMPKGLIHAQLARRIPHDVLRGAVLTRLRSRRTSKTPAEAVSLPNTDRRTFRRIAVPLLATH